MNDGHESPVNIAFRGRVKTARDCNMTDNIIGADKVNTEVASLSMINVHCDSDMLETFQIGSLKHLRCNLEGDSQSFLPLGNSLIDMDPR